MDEKLIAGRSLLDLAEPFLRRGDRAGLSTALQEEWNADCLALLLDSDDSELLRVVAICIGLIGDMTSCPSLMPLLHHRQDAVAHAAEDALWSIWFRACNPLGRQVLSKIAEHIRHGETENVVAMLTDLIRTHPHYAEAFHQRSQTHFLENNYDSALRDARRAFQLNPYHFGALANVANCYAALGRYAEALATYQRVLELCPRMPEVDTVVHQLEQRLAPTERPPFSLTLVTDPD